MPSCESPSGHRVIVVYYGERCDVIRQRETTECIDRNVGVVAPQIPKEKDEYPASFRSETYIRECVRNRFLLSEVIQVEFNLLCDPFRQFPHRNLGRSRADERESCGLGIFQ
jgi:hypothetical protein